MNAPARIKAARILRTPEQPIHEGIVQLLKFCARVPWRHVPNGEARSPRTGAKLKRMGVQAGVADFHLTLPGGITGWLEVKASNGRQSSDQKAFQAAEEAAGARYAIVRSIDEARTVLASWGALKGREAA
jgi:hypothetical protein